jgi:hypothetical protein
VVRDGASNGRLSTDGRGTEGVSLIDWMRNSCAARVTYITVTLHPQSPEAKDEQEQPNPVLKEHHEANDWRTDVAVREYPVRAAHSTTTPAHNNSYHQHDS